ncbi:MAG: 2-oxoacid:acceptor oxidoreductase family protein [Candidatus Omnitrophica bacterium]|nr:2-oxoacid:acceptor oxidoreductase family protein [Candidatus Omnitrophota bacterium]
MLKEKKHISRFELLMDAGFGAQKAGDILINAFAKMGKYVYIEPMIPSEISPPPRTKPAMSGVIIRLADFDLTNIGNNTDLIIASHEIVLDRRLDDQETNPNCRVLLDMGDRNKNEESYEQVCRRVTKLGLHVFPFEIDDESKAIIKELSGKGKNMYYLGILSDIYNMSTEILINEIKETFQSKLKEDILNKNIQLFKNGFNLAKKNILFSFEVDGAPHKEEQILIDGNSSMALGIIDAGFKFFGSYPITPASSIMHLLAKEFPAYGGVVHQAEDEIAAVGATIGAYAGGAPGITCTSGPGLSLKQEFIGFATAAEIPLVVINVQRGGPSTGMPTKTEQADLPAAIFGSHGDNIKVVLSVGNIIDCFYAPQMARYIAEKLKIPVFIMSDFQTANSYKVIEKQKTNEINNIDEIPDFVFERFCIKRLPDDIEMVRTSQTTPGDAGGMRRVTGLNTDIDGNINYFAGTNQRSHQVRNEKIHHVKRALTKPEMFGEEEGDVLVIGWGSTRGAIEEAVNNCRRKGLAVSGMYMRVVYPLPGMLKEIFQKFKYVVTAELSYGDPLKPPALMMLLRGETLIDVQSITCRATGRPIQPKSIQDKIKELINTGTI